jgi:lipopolysaccharide export system protein LptA
MKAIFSLLLCLIISGSAMAQTDSTLKMAANATKINLIHADTLIGTSGDGKQYNILIGGVSLSHNGSTLNCDSAYLYLDAKLVEAFGHVQINTTNGAVIISDYLKYNGNTSLAYLRGNVQIQDGANNITSEDLTYNVITKVAKYSQGATITKNATVVTSDIGTYNGKSNESYFKGNVIVTDDKYNIESKEMKFNGKNNITTFLDESTIITDNNIIVTKSGTYDGAKEIGNFNSRTLVYSDEQEIAANKINFNKLTGISVAIGNVTIEDLKNNRIINANKTTYNEKIGEMMANGNVFIEDFKNNRSIAADKTIYNEKIKEMQAEGKVVMKDFDGRRAFYAQRAFYNERNGYNWLEKNVLIYDSVENSILQCGKVESNTKHKITLATIKPVIRTLSDKDSLFIRADSFFTAPSSRIDTLKKVVPKFWSDSTTTEVTDSLRTLLGLGKVMMFTDSMQAICDSMSYSQKDSIFRLFKNPILWNTDNQAIGDTINILTVNNQVKTVLLLNNSTVISHIKKDNLYNQVGGINITAQVDSNQLKDMFVDGNAESIYYNTNEKDEYEGVNKSSSAQMTVLMQNKKLNKIIFYSEPEGVFSPVDKNLESTRRIKGFTWLNEKRPINKLTVVNQ